MPSHPLLREQLMVNKKCNITQKRKCYVILHTFMCNFHGRVCTLSEKDFWQRLRDLGLCIPHLRNCLIEMNENNDV